MIELLWRMVFKVGGLTRTETIAKKEYQVSRVTVEIVEVTQVVLHKLTVNK